MPAKIHRIGIAVSDLDKAVDRYTALFGGTFTMTGEAVSEEAGVRVAADWNLGIELVSPLPGSANPIARRMQEFLAEKGDGVFAVGYTVEDTAAALARAKEAGVEPLLPTFSFTEQQLQDEFAGAFTKFEETVLDTRDEFGITHAFNMIEYA
jgi:catechol 2,3-dioxygenase-like lactoylglutathione lyase family enzyme